MVMGGCGLAYEYTISKLASDLLGNSVKQWAIIIGVMMFFMGVGADLQKHFSSKKMVHTFIGGEIALGLVGAFGPLAMLYTYGQFYTHYIFVQYTLVATIGLLIGLEIPLLTRINEQYSRGLKFNLGSMLRMDYIGALLGALVWVFLLPKYFSLVETGFVLGFITILTAMVALVFFRRQLHRPWGISSFGVVSLILVGLGFSQASRWEVDGLQYLYKDQVVLTKKSIYQHVVVTRSQANHISLYINGHLQFNSADEAVYHENLVHPAMSLAPRKDRVLILGGGDGLAAREVLKYPEVKHITLCDLDPMITELARTDPYFLELNQGSLGDKRVQVVDNQAHTPGPLTGISTPNQKNPLGRGAAITSEVNIINMDAVAYLRQVPGLFDVVIIDFPDPNAPELAKLYSRWFYELVQKRMTPGAIMVQQSTSPYFAKEAFLNIGRTMSAAGLAVIPYHDNVPSFGEWGFWLGGGRKWHQEHQLYEQMASIESLEVDTKYLTPQLMGSTLLFGRDRLTTTKTDINTIVSGKLHEYYLQGWQASH